MQVSLMWYPVLLRHKPCKAGYLTHLMGTAFICWKLSYDDCMHVV